MQGALNKKYQTYLSLAVLLCGALLFSFFSTVSAANTPNRSLTISSSRPSQSPVDYKFNFEIVGSYSLGSIVFEICQEDPLPNEPCTIPSGFSASGVSLINQSGETGFSISALSTNNRVVLARPAALTTNTSLTYTLAGVTNPSSTGTFFARIYTYANSNGTGINIDDGGIAFAINNALNYDAEVPPFLFFCSGVTIAGFDCRGNNTSSGLFVDFGEFSTQNTSYGTSQVMAATNARSGFNIYVEGETLTSGNNTIPGVPTPTGSNQGQSQFGLNLRDNSNPDVGQDPLGPGSGFVTADYNSPNRYKFKAGDALARSTGTTNFSKFTVSYVVNVSQNQKPGTYNTTLTYICLANF